MADSRHGSDAGPESGVAFSPILTPRRGTGLLKGEKAVTISEEPETIPPEQSRVDSSPLLLPSQESRHHRASMSGKRLTGRPATNLSSTSVHSFSSQISQLKLDDEPVDVSKAQDPSTLLSQVVGWLHEEKSKRLHRKHRLHRNHNHEGDGADQYLPTLHNRSDSQTSESAIALEKLEKILSGYAAAGKEGIAAGKESLANLGSGYGKHIPSLRRRHSASRKMMKKGSVGASSDTEYFDGDVLVPNVEAVLDNSKTMAYSGGGADQDLPVTSLEKKSREKENWSTFKQDIIRLTHTLRLKGWRRIPIEKGGEIEVERLSGALTNAVYVVSPPKKLPQPDQSTQELAIPVSKKPPAKLLLRVYGPQVEHLIDRDSELAILRRLSRKRIGPRLLGTFSNGRFEEFFHARTLTPEDLRNPSTSKSIAKRMRELHDGIELLEEERDGGPFVFKNWDSWVDRCEQIITWLDEQISSPNPIPSLKNARWRKRGLVLGVQWRYFRQTVERAMKYLNDVYGGPTGVRERLVFAHNDTQYGNLLELTPSGESPLLLPANSHKRLVVIDFEYASANTPAQEFANHFTEWCYNYHHPIHPHRCNTSVYPNAQEQQRFIRSYIDHRPQFTISTPKASPMLSPGAMTPNLSSSHGTSSISNFMLDSRAPPGVSHGHDYEKEEKAREEEAEREVKKLMEETRLWRVANSAQWVAWGIVQAKMPKEFEDGIDGKDEVEEGNNGPEKEDEGDYVAMTDPLDPEVKQLAEDSKRDRPESRWEEEAHREGEAHHRHQQQSTVNTKPSTNHEDKIEQQYKENETSTDPKELVLTALLRQGSREGERAAKAESEASSRPVSSAGGTVGFTSNVDGPSRTATQNTPDTEPKPDPTGKQTKANGDAEQALQEQQHEQMEADREAEGGEDEDETPEFDYLAYAADRALFFWGDVLQLGIVREEELPGELRKAVKIVGC